MKKKTMGLLLILGILYNIAFLNNDSNNSLIQNIYGHNFTPDNYASFVASIDQFQTESNLVELNLVNNNTSLAQKHADEAVSIFYWDLMVEIAERDKKISDDLKTSVESLNNISLSFSESIPTSPATTENTVINNQKQLPPLQQASQLVSIIDANVDSLINMTEAQQKAEESNFLNQITGFLSSIFTGQQDSDNVSIHPMRFVELLDSVLRNYGDAYDVDFDMTDMSNMAMMNNDSFVADNNISAAANSNVMDMKSTNTHTDNSSSRTSGIVNMVNYQTAQGLSEKLLEIFNNELKPIISKNESSAYSDNLESGINQLISSINNKASPMDIMMVVHTQIHPNLIEAFDIQLLSNA